MGNRILVTRSSMPPMEEYFEEVAPIWESHWLTNMGVEHKKLEADLKERLGIDNLALFGSVEKVGVEPHPKRVGPAS